MPPTIDLTQYTDTASVAFPGMLRDSGPSRKTSFENAEVSAAVPPGVGVIRNTELKGKLPALASDLLAGVAIHTHARDNVAGQNGYAVGAEVSVLEEGAIYVQCEQTVTVDDPVYVRFAVNTTEQLGAFRKDSDSGKARLVKGARWVAGGGVSNPPALYFSAAVELGVGDKVEIPFSHGTIAATTTAFINKLDSGRQFILDEVVYDNPTGFAQDATNTWQIEIKRGATSEAKYDTTTGQQGTLGADAPVSLVNQALANRVNPPGQRIDLVITKTAAPANLPAGSGFIRGRYV